MTTNKCWYRIVDITSGRCIGGVFATSEKTAKAWATRNLEWCTFKAAYPV